MFSVGYNNKSMVINTIQVHQIGSRNIEKLRRLIIQLLRNPYGKIVLNIAGVKSIDRTAIKTFYRLHKLADKQNVELSFANVDQEVLKFFQLVPDAQNFKIKEIHNFQYKNRTEIFY